MSTTARRPPKTTTTPTTRLGRRIRKERLRLDLTQAGLAERMGPHFTGGMVSQAETTHNVRTLWPALIEALADALSLDPDELYAMADRIPPDIEVRLRGNLDAIKRTRKALADA